MLSGVLGEFAGLAVRKSGRTKLPGLKPLEAAFDRLEDAIAKVVKEPKPGTPEAAAADGNDFRAPEILRDRTALVPFVNAVRAELAAVGPFELDRAKALTSRTLGMVRLAGQSERYPPVISDIEELPAREIHEILRQTVDRFGIDQELHDGMLMLAGGLVKALLHNADPLAQEFVELAMAYQDPNDSVFEPVRHLEAYIKEAMVGLHWIRNGPGIESLVNGRRILDATGKQQFAITELALRAFGKAIKSRHRVLKYSNGVKVPEWQSNAYKYAVADVLRRLLRRKLPFTDEVFVNCFRVMQQANRNELDAWSSIPLIGAVERHVKTNGLGKSLRDEIEKFHKKSASYLRDDSDKRLERLLGQAERKIIVPNSRLGQAIVEFINSEATARQQWWMKLLELGLATANKAQPNPKWRDEAAEAIAQIGADNLVGRLIGLLEEPGIWSNRPEPCSDVLKGLIWAVAPLEDERLAPALSRLCETCYRKAPGVGPANIKIGNACMYALGELSGERAVAELVRLRSRIKFNQGRKQIEKALSAVADRTGLSVTDLEEMALPDFGLDPDGTRRETLGDVTVEIRIAGSDAVALEWIGSDGKPRKSVPASVKRDYADDLKDLRAEIKEIKGLLSGQRFRLESLYLQQRTWPYAVWRARYLDHPMMANLTRRLIWTVGGTPVIPAGDTLVGADGKAVKAPGATAEVSLWHPIDADADAVLAWRRRIAALEITQPFKQAHREIYVLTDAERMTETYSNRFAANILRQGQLNALCQARAWRYGQFLLYDMTGTVPMRRLPGTGLHAEFWIDPVDYDQYTEATGAYLFLASDQVRFVNEMDAAVRLTEVPPLILSEVMRDVDLFVGVASVGANPEWQDGGPEGRHREYWWGYSFGDVGERGKTRHAVLAELLPKLNIADRCELTEKFLTVRGTKRTYKIHLGSGNILMEPNDQYLCIVQGRSDSTKGVQNIRLPFEGDGVFSIILSKAFMLAEDDKITDKTILSQIGR